MKLIALMPARNEGWVLGLSARVALMWCDEIVLLNHASTDNTVDVIAELQAQHPFRVHLISVPESQWSEMEHRQMMLELARTKGATHIAIVDADEILTGNLINTNIDRLIETMPDRALLQLPGYNLRCSLHRYHTNGTWGRRWFSTVFADDPRLHWFDSTTRKDQFHHREPFGMYLEPYRPVFQSQGGTMHLWGITDRRLRAKHALYKVTERLRWPEKPVERIDEMYSWAFTGQKPPEPSNWLFADVPAEWWEPYRNLIDTHLDVDAEPWQESEVRRLVEKHGKATFAGLNLFDLC